MLCKELPKDELKLKSKVLSLSYSHDGKSTLENWSLSYASDRDKRSQGSSFDAVIMTVSSSLFRRQSIFSNYFYFLLPKEDHLVC